MSETVGNVRLRFTTQQAAEYASCHVDTVRRACESGVLRAGQRKKNGRWSIRLEDLDRWLDGERVAS